MAGLGPSTNFNRGRCPEGLLPLKPPSKMTEFFLDVTKNELEDRFEVTGRFYVIKGKAAQYQCRDLLEIRRCGVGGALECDAVFIMMNPGSSEPAVEIEPVQLHRAVMVATKPDRTQFQLMRLMGMQGWSRLKVLNLSDLRETSSSVFYGRFKDFEHLEANDGHSIFSSSRQEQLHAGLRRKSGAPVFLAWGVHRKLKGLAQWALHALSTTEHLGLSHKNGEWAYRHPLPQNGAAQKKWRGEAHAALQAFVVDRVGSKARQFES